MKKALFALLILSATTGQAQTVAPGQPTSYPKDAATGLIDFTEVVPVEGASKAELFTRAKLWAAGSFKLAKDVVLTEDKDAGILAGKGFSIIVLQSGRAVAPAKLFYTLKLNFKDGKYKYELTDLYFENEPSAAVGYKVYKTPAETWVLAEPKGDSAGKIIAQYKSQFDQTVQALLASLKAAMLKTSDF